MPKTKEQREEEKRLKAEQKRQQKEAQEKRKLQEKAAKLLVKRQKAEEKAAQARAEMEGKTGKARQKAYEKADKLRQKAAAAKSAHKLAAGLADGTISKEEDSRQFWSRFRHRAYNFVKFFVDLTQKKNPCTQLDHPVEHNGAQLINQGRIYLGGTKPMYEYQDEANPDRKFLFKEAITCVGTKKPEGSLVCEAAYKLQRAINPTSAIETFTQKDANHEVLGSFQEKVSINPNAIDLFEWQNQPAAERQNLSDDLKAQILREHTVDWLIGNFDTKGENFVIDTDGHLRGIDKEQAFSYLTADGAAHMSRTYQPNPNNTLYNVIFSEFAAGRMNLNLNEVMHTIQNVERIPRDEYLEMFDEALEAKSKGNAQKKAELQQRMIDRKDNLREEYRNFFKSLVEERYPVDSQDEVQNQQNRNKRGDYLDEAGNFVFAGEGRMTANERAAENAAREAAARENTAERENAPVRERMTKEEVREIMGTARRRSNTIPAPVKKAPEKAAGMGGM